VSYGIFGLIDAIEKYDLERGIKFETYAISRIKGAIVDELRLVGSERGDRLSLVDTLEDKGAEDPGRSSSPRR
jgi:DNA-directed RNA polymerase specialized sigma subunit